VPLTPKAVRVRTTEGWQDIAVTGPQGPPGVPGALVGAPIPWLVSTIPSGYLEFNGQAITEAQYPQLYALFGANLPDLRDKFLFGASATYPVGSVGGTATHTLSAAEMPAHSHTVNSHNHGGGNHSHSLAGGNPWAANGVGHTADGTAWQANTNVMSIAFSGNTISSEAPGTNSQGSGAAHNNLPPYRAVRWITAAG
jgi:microcystin-dependent protein